MGLPIGSLKTATESFVNACAKRSILQTKPQSLNGIDISKLKRSPVSGNDTVGFASHVKNAKLKFFSADEIANIKPSEFSEVLLKRNDIAPSVKEYILTPEKLNLYDELMCLEAIRNMPKDKLNKVFSSLFSAYNNKISESSAQLEVIPKLVKRGCKIEDLAGMPILHSNKNQIEYVLNNKEKLVSKMWKVYAENLTKRYKRQGLSEKALSMTLDCNKKDFDLRSIRQILSFVNNKNVKYLDECIELTGNVYTLPYWNKDTSKIIKEFCTLDLADVNLLDRLHRRGHDYASVKKIFGDTKMTELTSRVLEFKDYEKFKNIGTEEFQKLPVEDKKHFLNAFISAISPKEAAFRSQHSLINNFDLLGQKVKIFKELDSTSNEAFLESYNNTIRKMLNSIPDSQRQLIRTELNAKSYMKNYREANPIPALVDDIDAVLKSEIVNINGKNLKVAQMDADTAFGISTHRMPNAESILTIEALEITDPKMLLCVGTRGGSRGLNASANSYALALKPRKGNDWHVQAYGDIDSGNNASKNLFNFENIMLPSMGNHCDAIDLIPNLVKKKLNLSQKEYTQRMSKLKDCTTLQDIAKKDMQMANTLREIIEEQRLYEGLIRPEPMGILVDYKKPLETISQDILDYCERRNISLIRVKF